MKWVRPTLRVNDAELSLRKRRPKRGVISRREDRPTWSCKQLHRRSTLHTTLPATGSERVHPGKWLEVPASPDLSSRQGLSQTLQWRRWDTCPGLVTVKKYVRECLAALHVIWDSPTPTELTLAPTGVKNLQILAGKFQLAHSYWAQNTWMLPMARMTSLLLSLQRSILRKKEVYVPLYVTCCYQLINLPLVQPTEYYLMLSSIFYL